MMTVIAYDVALDAARSRVATYLEDYGRRINYSVFECELSAADAVRIAADLEALIDCRTDRVVLYRICSTCSGKRQLVGCLHQVRGDDGNFIAV